jgi:hypothetical protein
MPTVQAVARHSNCIAATYSVLTPDFKGINIDICLHHRPYIFALHNPLMLRAAPSPIPLLRASLIER